MSDGNILSDHEAAEIDELLGRINGDVGGQADDRQLVFWLARVVQSQQGIIQRLVTAQQGPSEGQK